jgi:hypothetical protein
MLPPLTVAGSAAVLAVASLFAGDTGLLRALTVAAALTAMTGATIARAWDRSAGRRVAELVTLRTRDEWRTDERIAELEIDLEEFREIRDRLEKKLRGKRSELARLRTEHADLLRRYATAETERARVLEARRLQVDGAAVQPLALGAGTSPVRPAAYLKAAQALRDLPRNAARQQAQQTVEDARRRDTAGPEEPQGKHASGSAAALPVREPRLVPAVAAAVLPYAKPARGGAHPPHRSVGGFDFFGTQKAAGPEEDSSAEGDDPDHARAPSEVIDLTAHDETEQLDVTGLRAQA